MLNSTCNKGMTLVEVLVAVVLITIGLLGLMTLQPTAWRASNRSDFTGRAAMILQQELETNRAWIMNASNASPTALNNPKVDDQTIYASGQASLQQQGDVPYRVITTTTDLAPSGTPNSWRVAVQVTWPGNNVGITDSVIVGRQLSFMWPPL